MTMTKQRYNRREFMGLTGAGIASLIGAQWSLGKAWAQGSAAQEPDLVVFNAKVYTVDPLVPRAEAFAFKAGRFVAIASTDEVKSLARGRAQVFDAKQMTVLP